VTLLRDLGAALSPFNAFLILQGIETVTLRMKAHCENALAVVRYLQGRKEVTVSSTPPPSPARPPSGRANTCRAARAGWSVSSWRAAPMPAGGSSTASN